MLTAFCSVTCFSQSAEDLREDIVEAIPTINKSLPIEGENFSLDKMGYVDESLAIYVTLDDSEYSFDLLFKECQDNILRRLSAMSAGDESLELFMQLITLSDMNIMCCYKGVVSGKEGKIIITPEQLTAALDSDAKTESRDMIESTVVMYNSELPKEIGQGMTLTKITFEGDYIVYYFNVNGQKQLIDALKQYKDTDPEGALEGAISEFNSSNDIESDTFKQCIKTAACGIRYLYYDEESGDKVPYDITPEMFLEKIH